MAASWILSARGQKNFSRFLAVLTSAACEWFLIFLLLVDGVLSYLLTKFADYCELQKPCLLCSRLDQILGNEKPQFYWSLFCGNHRLEISSLISCNMHGKLADGRAICEDCLLSFTTKENCSPETHRPFFGKLGFDYGNFYSHSLLRRDFVPRSCSTGLCSCCKKPLMSRQKARRSLYRSPVGRSIKPSIPLPRMPNHNRLHRRDGLRKVNDRFSGSLAYKHLGKLGSESPSQGGYSELKITSDSDPELVYFNEDDHSSMIDDTNKMKDCFPVKCPSKTKPKALSVDLGSYNLVQRSSESGHSLLDFDFLLAGEPVDMKCMDSDAAVGNSLSDLNSQRANERSQTNSTAELISLDDAYPTSGIFDNPLGIFGRDYKSKFPILRNSKSPSFTDLMSLDVTSSSDGTTEKKVDFSEKMDSGPSSVIDQVKAYTECTAELKADQAIADSDGSHPTQGYTAELKVDQAISDSDGSCPTHVDSSIFLGSTVKNEGREKPDFITHGSAPSQVKSEDCSSAYGSTVKSDRTEESGSILTDSAPLQLKSAESSDVHEPIVNTEAGKESESEPFAEQLLDDADRNNEKDKEREILDVPTPENSFAHETSSSSSNADCGINCKGDEVQMVDISNSNGTDKLKRSLSTDRSESALESLDGSIISEHEGESITDGLKRQLQNDQKRINALYKELEEERSASAVAANQAMAMITRLQEEKAALHMEALQYLRMMEEQAEHDVDALERANDLLAEKEREIQDLEAELEYYRNNAPDELAMERMLDESYNLSRENMKDNDASASFSIDNASPPDTRMMTGESKGNKELLANCQWFEDDKLYISQCLKSLERQLQQVPCDRTAEALPYRELSEKATYDAEHQEPTENDDNNSDRHWQEGDLCRQENKPTYSRHHTAQEASVSSIGGDCLDHKNDYQEASDCRRSSIVHKEINVAGLENEISDLNDRLESLEAVHDFIEHTLNNLQSGDAGLLLLQEMVKKLRELQNMGIRIRSESVT